jgi:hypothetical protein
LICAGPIVSRATFTQVAIMSLLTLLGPPRTSRVQRASLSSSWNTFVSSAPTGLTWTHA